jgi:hypothetical protein
MAGKISIRTPKVSKRQGFVNLVSQRPDDIIRPAPKKKK